MPYRSLTRLSFAAARGFSHKTGESGQLPHFSAFAFVTSNVNSPLTTLYLIYSLPQSTYDSIEHALSY